MYLGSHISISKGYEKAVKQAYGIGANTLQFFTRNPRGSRAKALDFKDIEKTHDFIAKKGFGPLVGHAPYTLNLGSYKDETWSFAVDIIRDDLKRLEAINSPFVIIHPGKHLGKGEEYALNRIAEGLNRVLENHQGKTKILLEGMGGMGTEVCYTFEQLKYIIESVENSDSIGVCLDSCHLYAAGYDVKKDFDGVLKLFDSIVGLDKLMAFHLNDSKHGLNSRKDRHANIGEGKIGEEGVKKIINHPFLKEIPIILETPGSIDNYEREIKLLKSWITG